jgi:hypothetical protein
MDSTTTRYLADLLRDHGDQIVKRWTAAVASNLRGRLGEAEPGWGCPGRAGWWTSSRSTPRPAPVPGSR